MQRQKIAWVCLPCAHAHVRISLRNGSRSDQHKFLTFSCSYHFKTHLVWKNLFYLLLVILSKRGLVPYLFAWRDTCSLVFPADARRRVFHCVSSCRNAEVLIRWRATEALWGLTDLWTCMLWPIYIVLLNVGTTWVNMVNKSVGFLRPRWINTLNKFGLSAVVRFCAEIDPCHD